MDNSSWLVGHLGSFEREGGDRSLSKLIVILDRYLATSLRGYRQSWLLPDLGAATTLIAIAIPEQLATSRLAGMPPITGYYAFIAGSLVFALFGSNRLISIGADSTIAPLFAAGIAHLAPIGSVRYVDLVAILAVLVGIFVAAVGLFRLGWIAEFLSLPIINGFLGGVAVIIAIHQLPDLLAVSAPGGSNFHRLLAISSEVGHTNLWSLLIGLGVLSLLVVAESIDQRLPGALIALGISAILVAFLHLSSRGVPILGAFTHAAPRFGLAGLSFGTLGRLAPTAAVVALVVISQTAVTSRAFGDSSFDVDIGRDFVGVGTGSIVSGLFGSFAVNASPPRSAAVQSSGGRSQVTGLLASAGLLALIPASGALKDVPLSALAAVLLYIAARLFHGRELLKIARFSYFEILLALVTLLTVVLVGVEQGIAVAVGIAIVERARLSARPQLHVLGRLTNTTSWVPIGRNRDTEQVLGILVTLFAAPLWYANVGNFELQFAAAVAKSPKPIRVVVLDAVGMSDIDFTGIESISAVLDRLKREGIIFVMARVGERVTDSLERSGLLARIGRDHLFPSAQHAVSAAERW